MNKTDQSKLIYSGKYPLPLEAATKKSYKILLFRSSIEYGLIKSIKIPELPDNFYIFSSKDLKGRYHILIDGAKIPVLAENEVNYIGEPILILLGPNSKQLNTICKKIEITYEELPKKKEIFFSKSVDIGDSNKLFLTAHKIVTGRMNTPTRVVKKKLPIGAFTKRESDSYIVHTSSIWPKDLRDNISAICNTEKESIKIITPNNTGEDEDSLIDNYYSSIYTTLCSSIIKKNILHSCTPKEEYLYSSNDYGLKGSWKMAFNKDNNLLGIKVLISLDCGAYPVFVREKVLRILHGITSFYKHKNIFITVDAVKSNRPPVGVVNTLYLSDALFFAELIVSKIIKETNSDQLKWRESQILRKGHKNNTLTIIKSDLPLFDMLKQIGDMSDFSRKNSSINLALSRKTKRIGITSKKGIGLSLGYNGNSFISNDKSLMAHSINIQLNRDEKVDLRISCRLRNLEILTIWSDIISNILNVDSENITFHSEDSSTLEDSSPNIENKNIMNLTGLIKQCCEEIKIRRFKDPLPISQIKTGRRTSSQIWNPERWIGDPFKNSSYGSCVMEVEIDKRSLNIVIKEIWLILDVGQIIHKTSIVNAVNREIINTIDWLQNSSPSFIDGQLDSFYFFNRSKSKNRPKVNITFNETGKSRSVGSLIKNLLPGAYIQGVNQALGSNFNFFPIDRQMIFKEIKKDEV